MDGMDDANDIDDMHMDSGKFPASPEAPFDQVCTGSKSRCVRDSAEPDS
jgi:hypothetical protein